MSFKSTLVKFAIEQSPKKMVFWLANKKTKGIVKLPDDTIDFDQYKFYAQILLYGEDAPIELKLEDFVLTPDENTFHLSINHIQSNRPWLETLLTRFILKREWHIPEKHADFIHELLASDAAEKRLKENLEDKELE